MCVFAFTLTVVVILLLSARTMPCNERAWLQLDSDIIGLVSFIHSAIHSSFCPFIHSAVRFPSLPAVIYSVELERQAAECRGISAFLSRHSTAHESPELKEKEAKDLFVLPCVFM